MRVIWAEEYLGLRYFGEPPGGLRPPWIRAYLGHLVSTCIIEGDKDICANNLTFIVILLNKNAGGQ